MPSSTPRRTAAAMISLGAALLGGAAVAAADDFSKVVRQILDSQTTGPLSEMDTATRSAMTDCVVTTLQGLPKGIKRFVVEGQNFGEQTERFGKVVYDDHAKWERNIARACADIALGGGGL